MQPAALTRDLDPPHTTWLSALRANLDAGVRLAFGARPQPFRAMLGDVVCTLALLWILVMVREWIDAGPGARLWTWGLVASAARQYVWLAALAMIAWCWLRGRQLALLVTALGHAMLGILFVTGVAEWTAARLELDIDTPYTTVYYGAVLVWSGAVLWRALAWFTSAGSWRRLSGCALYVGALYVAQHGLPASPIFYQETAQPAGLDIEAIYYRQPALVDGAVRHLRAEVPGAVDWYYIGVAAFAGQDVFKREVEQVERIVTTRLGAAGRSLNLINNRETIEHVALANRHNLERAVAGVAARMNREEDVLFLFLTSHGYHDASIAVDFAELGLNDIYAQDVRRMLDDAGVRWRVIVVSACYSGSFIDELRSPESLIITAAASDRASFGCSHENAWTYFGRAYFADALSQTTDLVRAFDLARQAIAARERRELKRASRPQIAAGAALSAHLRRWTPSHVPGTAHSSDSR